VLFIRDVIRASHPQRVLDIGCGTGAHLTMPLAAAFPETAFLGVDSDEVSIRHASACKTLPNLRFATQAGGEGAFDLIIASEVIEHVDDPEAFLLELRRMLSASGCLVLTLPNGYGPSELSEFLRTLLVVTRMYRAVRAVAAALGVKASPRPAAADTLAVSPHVNFFSYPAITRLIRRAGFAVERYQPRTLFCGFGFDRAMRGRRRLVAWNARVADLMAPAFSSDWMFVLRPARAAAERAYRRGWYARLRRRLNFAAARLGAGA
jgi:SAM-dependent methyltransferase